MIFVSIILLVLLASVVAAQHGLKRSKVASHAVLIRFSAVPVLPDQASDRFFGSNHQGAIEYNNTAEYNLTSPRGEPPGPPPTGK